MQSARGCLQQLYPSSNAASPNMQMYVIIYSIIRLDCRIVNGSVFASLSTLLSIWMCLRHVFLHEMGCDKRGSWKHFQQTFLCLYVLLVTPETVALR